MWDRIFPKSPCYPQSENCLAKAVCLSRLSLTNCEVSCRESLRGLLGVVHTCRLVWASKVGWLSTFVSFGFQTGFSDSGAPASSCWSFPRSRGASAWFCSFVRVSFERRWPGLAPGCGSACWWGPIAAVRSWPECGCGCWSLRSLSLVCCGVAECGTQALDRSMKLCSSQTDLAWP